MWDELGNYLGTSASIAGASGGSSNDSWWQSLLGTVGTVGAGWANTAMATQDFKSRLNAQTQSTGALMELQAMVNAQRTSQIMNYIILGIVALVVVEMIKK